MTALEQVRTHPMLRAAGRNVRYAKGETLFRTGDVFPDLVIMHKGLVKLTYDTFDGKEWIKSFIDGAGAFTSLASHMTGMPSTFNAIAIEPVEAILVSATDFAKASDSDPALAKAIVAMVQTVALKKELREYALLCTSAEERYQAFLRDHQGIAQRISQVDMARYLGITPVALSRIKKRLGKTAKP